MLINLRVICSRNFYLKIDDSITVKKLYEIISEKTKTKNFIIRREGCDLHESLDLNTYEFSENECVELIYRK